MDPQVEFLINWQGFGRAHDTGATYESGKTASAGLLTAQQEQSFQNLSWLPCVVLMFHPLPLDPNMHLSFN